MAAARRLVLDNWFRDTLARVQTADDLKKSIASLTGHFGIRYFMLQARLAVPGNGSPPALTEMFISNTSEEWIQYCLREDLLGRHGPFVSRFIESAAPVRWTNMAAASPERFEVASSLGLRTGITNVVRTLHRARSLVSYIWDSDGPNTEAQVDAFMANGQLLACLIHEAAQRIARLHPVQPLPTPVQHIKSAVESGHQRKHGLTKRERECLLMAIDGKTARQTSIALAITERTVIFHLAQARRRLGASNSRQAASKALAMGLLVDEAK